MYEKILVPLDGSKTAETSSPNVIRLARESDAKAVLFTVEPPGPTAVRTESSRTLVPGSRAKCDLWPLHRDTIGPEAPRPLPVESLISKRIGG